MKNLLMVLVMGLLLTGCFGKDKVKIDDGGLEVPDVVIEEGGDEDSKDGDDLGETQDAETDSSEDDTPGVDGEDDVELSEEEKQAEAEVLDEFEGDLDEIFKDLGV